ncbi:hypothetical protein [Luteimonas kalidii]|uniref:WG repeat-containing protein n=1 Tax=Luteimonas kalidii TaxID=3042025 RepID=A0ABT6JXS9_9GAMM|nr:hypothetical protein [Luteimonas kalidii]MDH5835509.1 hypothetical protein [Luteimonas kalidii]
MAALAACTGAGPASGVDPDTRDDASAEALSSGSTNVAGRPMPGLVDPRPLQGAGPVAFDAAGRQLAWGSNGEVRLLAPGHEGGERRMDVGGAVGDLAFAPGGALWLVVDGVPQLWRDGAMVCAAEDTEADRVLAVDAQGAVVARYAHGDGVGMLRHQAWLDGTCARGEMRIDPLPAGVEDSDADPGAAFGRETLRRVHAPAEALAAQLEQVQLPAGAGIRQAVAVSADGGWWVLEGAQGRTLWRREPDRAQVPGTPSR